MSRLAAAGLLVALSLPAVAEPAAAQAAGPAPVAREQIEATLRALESAYAREDLRAALALHQGVIRGRAEARLRKLFEARNYLVLHHRVVRSLSTPQGLEVEVVADLRSREVGRSSDGRAKLRWVYVFAETPGGAAIVDSRAADVAPFARSQTFDPLEWEGTVSLHPASPEEGSADIDLRVRLRAPAPGSGAPEEGAQEGGFALHPFARDVSVESGGARLALRRSEGATDQWLAVLPAAVAPGADVLLDLKYSIDTVGAGGVGSLGTGGAQLFTASAWHPIFRPGTADDPVRAEHELTVEAPAEWSVVVPGEMTGGQVLPGGRRRSTFASTAAGAELCVLAGPWKHARTQLASGIRVDSYSPSPVPSGLEPARDAARIAASALESHERVLGPAPAWRVTLVAADAGGMFAAPGVIVLPSLALPPEGSGLAREARASYFVAHAMAHVWLVDALALEGPGSGAIAEGLCDALAMEWATARSGPRLPATWRDQIIAPASLGASGDQPLVSPQGSPFGSGKAQVVFEMYRQMVGDDEWRRALGKWAAQALADRPRGGGSRPVAVESLLSALSSGGAERAAFVETWFRRQGFAEPGVVAVVARPLTADEVKASGLDADVWRKVEITLRNGGVGPVPVRMVAQLEGREEVVDAVLGEDETRVVTLDATTPPSFVRLDPDRLTWQSRVDDDEWPVRESDRPRKHGTPEPATAETIMDAHRRR